MPKHDPILESYEHDLALFTSLFCALTTTILWQYRYQHDNGDWQNILSILLNVDTSVFYSVTGTISCDAIRCIIHSKSTRMNSQHTRTCYQQIVPDGRTGARLLQQWATTPRSLNSHAQDIFNIIGCLRGDPDYLKQDQLVQLMHYRAAPKIHQIIMEMKEFWGEKSPFAIAQRHLSVIKKESAWWERSIQLTLDMGGLVIVRKFVEADESESEGERFTYHVNASTISNWIDCHIFLWEHLEEVSRTTSTSTGDVEVVVEVLTVLVSCLHQLRPIWVLILSLLALRRPLAAAEKTNGWARVGQLSTRKPDATDETATLNEVLNPKHNESYIQAIQHVSTITRWYTAAVSLGNRIAQFLDTKLVEAEWHHVVDEGGESATTFTAEGVIAVLRVLMSDKPKVENFQYVQNVARIARIHVEAGHLVCACVECFSAFKRNIAQVPDPTGDH